MRKVLKQGERLDALSSTLSWCDGSKFYVSMQKINLANLKRRRYVTYRFRSRGEQDISLMFLQMSDVACKTTHSLMCCPSKEQRKTANRPLACSRTCLNRCTGSLTKKAEDINKEKPPLPHMHSSSRRSDRKRITDP